MNFMNKDIKKHQLLRILSEQFILGWGTEEPTGLMNNEIKNRIKINDYQLKMLIADLCENGETKYYAPKGDKGWMATDKGIASFNTKKYKRIRNKNIWDLIKNWVQTLIPVLSLIITIMVILNNDKATNKELQELTKRIEYIEQQEPRVPSSTKIFPNQIGEKPDTLKTQ